MHRTTRTITTTLFSGVLAVGVLGAAATAAPVTSDRGAGQVTVSTASDAAKPKVSKSCKKALKKRSKAIKGATFGKCMTRAMTTSKTFTTVTKGPGFSDRTTYSYGATIDFDSRSEGARLVVVGSDAWLYLEELGEWTVADPNGSEEQQVLAQAVKESRKEMSAKTVSRPYAKGSSWKHTGKMKKIKGVKAWEYKGSTKGAYGPGIKVLKERVWLDKNFRQVKSTTKVRTEGVTFTLTQTVTGYGKKADLTAGVPRD